MTVVFIDIDDFKAINDRAGHAEGDRLLIRIAETLRSQLWGSDTVARLGGDEFAILLPRTGADDAHKVMSRVREALPREMHRSQLSTTFSAGVVTCVSSSPDTEQLLGMADLLMYPAKESGKDCIGYGLCTESAARGLTRVSP